jgi:hypothetical protein
MKKFIFTILFILVTSLSAWAGELIRVPYPSELDRNTMPAYTEVRNAVYNNPCAFGHLSDKDKAQLVKDYYNAFLKVEERKQELKSREYYTDKETKRILYVKDPKTGKLRNAGAVRAGFGVSVVRHPKLTNSEHLSIIAHFRGCAR